MSRLREWWQRLPVYIAVPGGLFVFAAIAAAVYVGLPALAIWLGLSLFGGS